MTGRKGLLSQVRSGEMTSWKGLLGQGRADAG